MELILKDLLNILFRKTKNLKREQNYDYCLLEFILYIYLKNKILKIKI
jgi:hypothetical protein